MVTAIDRIDALLAGITKADIQAMPSALRRRLAQALRRIADLADPLAKPAEADVGVLADLKDGQQIE
jgi:hypothetical protein